MNNVREVNRINERELDLAVEGGASWHDDYKDSAYIFVGGLDRRLTEGDVITIFSQYGEVLDINLPRIPEGGLRDRDDGGQVGSQSDRQRQQQQQQQQVGGKPGDRRGFGFLLYEDQRSTVLAVDNLNGFNLLGRTIRVDHVRDYKMPGAKKKEEDGELVEPSRNAAPAMIRDGSASESEPAEDDDDLDLADPMAAYIAASKNEKKRKGKDEKEDKEERKRRKEERRRKREEREAERARRKRASESGEPERGMERPSREETDRRDGFHSRSQYYDDRPISRDERDRSHQYRDRYGDSRTSRDHYSRRDEDRRPPYPDAGHYRENERSSYYDGDRHRPDPPERYSDRSRHAQR